jgi:hypothetical protein
MPSSFRSVGDDELSTARPGTSSMPVNPMTTRSWEKLATEGAGNKGEAELAVVMSCRLAMVYYEVKRDFLLLTMQCTRIICTGRKQQPVKSGLLPHTTGLHLPACQEYVQTGLSAICAAYSAPAAMPAPPATVRTVNQVPQGSYIHRKVAIGCILLESTSNRRQT